MTLEDLRTYEFFLTYHGKGGYTAYDVAEMTVDKLLWCVNRLKRQIDEENEAKEAELRRAQAKRSTPPPRSGVRVGRRR